MPVREQSNRIPLSLVGHITQTFLSRADFQPVLVIKGYQSRKNPTLANGRTLVLTDGRSFYIGTVGGPNDGADR